MSTNSATTTTSTDNGISLVEADERAEGEVGDDQLTISSLSSSLDTSTATTDTEGEKSGIADDGEGRKRKKRRVGGSFSRGSSVKDVEELDGEEPEGALTDLDNDEASPPYAEKTRNRAVARLITFSCILFTVPLTLMYLTYRFIFIDHFHLAHDRAILYAGITAAATVYLILAVFAWIAYRDESEFAQQMATVSVGEGDTKKTE